jgi:hypothetical protein
MSELFQIKCQKEILTQDEIMILERHGHFFHTLTSGDRSPETAKQTQFKQVFELKLRPQTNEEYTWWKYLTRLKWERNKLGMPWDTFLKKETKERRRKPTNNKPTTKTLNPNKKKTDNSKFSDKDKELIKKALERDRALEKRDLENLKPSVPEEYRRKVDEGIGGTREDCKKNQSNYDG